jgi:GNAT superfamily N-acetyltransferase
MSGTMRTAVYADIPRMVELRASVRENRLGDPTRVTLADYMWFIDNAAIHVWDDDTIRGLCAGDPRDGSIWGLFVDPDFEGRGIGQVLIAAACATLHQGGHRSVTLSTDAGTRAERFYLRNGWTPQGRNPRGEIIFAKALLSA